MCNLALWLSAATCQSASRYWALVWGGILTFFFSLIPSFRHFRVFNIIGELPQPPVSSPYLPSISNNLNGVSSMTYSIGLVVPDSRRAHLAWQAPSLLGKRNLQE